MKEVSTNFDVATWKILAAVHIIKRGDDFFSCYYDFHNLFTRNLDDLVYFLDTLSVYK